MTCLVGFVNVLSDRNYCIILVHYVLCLSCDRSIVDLQEDKNKSYSFTSEKEKKCNAAPTRHTKATFLFLFCQHISDCRYFRQVVCRILLSSLPETDLMKRLRLRALTSCFLTSPRESDTSSVIFTSHN